MHLREIHRQGSGVMQRLEVLLERLEGGRGLLIVELRSRIREVEACLRVEMILCSRAHDVRICVETDETII